ncbi:hypothetical protein APS56_09120 [Pseudalgibacter alginicilyticus]|uniref:CHAT domain-containing protein n=1 Tax=Pseudalgibacter alginicilyticus TaxID=1736674 RepID=A0A0P0DB20_9FLAO|nr:CHAT domain-containing tetratricopeptide repeat protein [Pseudalgibacter alginicilyticus]ALJ05272.1 hypothetical protein APS56_09120 [Pseudalgibacter alginicilyticus]
MYKLCFFIFFLTYGFSFSQNLEESIYVAAETFINNQNETSLQLLNNKEASFKSQVKTKDEHLALVFLQSHKGYYLDTHSKLKQAITTYEDALNRFNKNDLANISNFDIIENCLIPLGNLYTKIGDYTNAESTIKQYSYIAQNNKNTNHQISATINLATLYQTIGKHETAIKIIDDGLKKLNTSSNKRKHLQRIKTANLIALNKYDEAAFYNQESIFSKFHTYKNQYIIALKKGDYNTALTSFKKAKNAMNEAKLTTRDLAKFYVEEAQLYYLLNKPNEALKSLKKSTKILLPNFDNEGLPNKTHLYAENTFIDIFDLYANLQTNSEIKLESYNLSFYVSNLLRNSWTSQETKTLNETNNRIRSEKCIDILLSLYNKTKIKSHLFEALQYSENNKVSTLKEIFQKKTRLQHNPKDTLLAKEFKLLKDQEHITSLLINEQLGHNQASKINDLSKQLSAISIQLKKLKTAIAIKYPNNEASFSLKTLQNNLKTDNSVLVEYFYGESNIYQFVISNNNILLNRINLSTDIKNHIIEFIHLFDNASIINNNISNYTSKAFKLFQLLKFDTIPKSKNTIIIPDGLLNFIPFETLLTTNTNSYYFSKMPFVINNQNIVYNSSIYFYLAKNKTIKNNKLLGFFPLFKNTKKQLTYSLDEANAIRNEMTSELFIADKATKTDFIENANKYGILHLSTHASSGNFSKPANIDFYDNTLFLNELYSLNLNTNLVVLSACETGVGKLYKGEGAMSIARGFQYSGAKNLLFSLWQINDLSTSQIMQSFYKNYSNTQSACHSNQQSKLDYLQNKNISNAKKSPYYWGSFVYYGKLDKPNHDHLLFNIIIGMVLVLIAVFLLLKYKKQHGKDTARISS